MPLGEKRPRPVDDPEGKSQGTRSFSTKKFYILAVLGARTLKLRRDVGHHQMTPMAKVMVKVTMTFSTKN